MRSGSEDLDRGREELHALHSVGHRDRDVQHQALPALEKAEDAGREPDAHDGPPVREQLERLLSCGTLADTEEDRARAALLDVPRAAKCQRDETLRSNRDGLAARERDAHRLLHRLRLEGPVASVRLRPAVGRDQPVVVDGVGGQAVELERHGGIDGSCAGVYRRGSQPVRSRLPVLHERRRRGPMWVDGTVDGCGVDVHRVRDAGLSGGRRRAVVVNVLSSPYPVACVASCVATTR